MTKREIKKLIQGGRHVLKADVENMTVIIFDDRTPDGRPFISGFSDVQAMDKYIDNYTSQHVMSQRWSDKKSEPDQEKDVDNDQEEPITESI